LVNVVAVVATLLLLAFLQFLVPLLFMASRLLQWVFLQGFGIQFLQIFLDNRFALLTSPPRGDSGSHATVLCIFFVLYIQHYKGN
jgi:hypothetical protein